MQNLPRGWRYWILYKLPNYGLVLRSIRASYFWLGPVARQEQFCTPETLNTNNQNWCDSCHNRSRWDQRQGIIAKPCDIGFFCCKSLDLAKANIYGNQIITALFNPEKHRGMAYGEVELFKKIKEYKNGFISTGQIIQTLYFEPKFHEFILTGARYSSKSIELSNLTPKEKTELEQRYQCDVY